MGTDIIYSAEHRIADKWETLKDADGNDDFFCFGGDRNYDFFDFLCGEADPKTGLGFRGLKPLTKRRGVPDDYPPMKPEDVIEYGYSWILLQELVDFPWKEELRYYEGFADAENYLKFLEGERFRFSPTLPKHPYSPHSFPKDEWTVVSNEVMLDLITEEQDVDPLIYTPLKYTRTYDECFPFVLRQTIPTLQEYGDPQDIRIVFWFSC